ncbi:MAG TPA: chalcone isomerase family protein [Gammaproteobacteria bacterium]|nr:chalcone isomerase family protein [Gammaproteobacteria bacterium]
MPQYQGVDKHTRPLSKVAPGLAESGQDKCGLRPLRRRPALAGLLCGAALAASLASPAAEVAGIRFEERTRIAEGLPELVLNGAGIRSKFFVKVYAAGLYLPEKAGSTDAVLTLPGPKRVRMHFIHSEVSGEKIRSGWTDGYRANHSDAEYAELEDRVQRFNALFPTLKAGDVVDVDYIPGSGTAVRLNGETQGIIPGDDFYPATLKIWLGDSPAHGGLKKALLGEG